MPCVCLQTSQMLVRVHPCSSRALCLLGNAQLALSDCATTANHAASLLGDAKQSFSASIALEGAPAAGEPRPELTGSLPLLTYLFITTLVKQFSFFQMSNIFIVLVFDFQILIIISAICAAHL